MQMTFMDTTVHILPPSMHTDRDFKSFYRKGQDFVAGRRE